MLTRDDVTRPKTESRRYAMCTSTTHRKSSAFIRDCVVFLRQMKTWENHNIYEMCN